MVAKHNPLWQPPPSPGPLRTGQRRGGICVAPNLEDGRVDVVGLQRLVENQLTWGGARVCDVDE